MSLPYSTFASIYDSAMALDYYPWADFILKSYFKQAGRKPESVLDLGCGTGGLLSVMEIEQRTGVDIAESMIAEAKLNDPDSEYICQDLRELHLDRTYDLVISTHDTLNYIIHEAELLDLFRRIYNHLEPGGYFIGDVTSEANILKNFDQKTLEENHQGIHMVWENSYDRHEALLTSRLRFYDEDTGKLIDEEIHLQRYYPREKINELLKQAGFKIIATGSDYESWKEKPSASLLVVFAGK